MREDRDQHPSYGMVAFSRMHSSHGMQMFGSKIGHSTIIGLKIYEASQEDSFGKKRVVAEDKIIEVLLSPAQFSELLTTMNIGSGVPCTISRRQGVGSIEPKKQENPRKVSERYLRKTMEKVSSRMEDVEKMASKMASGKTASKADRNEIVSMLKMLRQEIEEDMPFVEKTFQEVMDKTVSEAKSDIDAFVTHTVTQKGLESLKNNVPLIAEDLT